MNASTMSRWMRAAIAGMMTIVALFAFALAAPSNASATSGYSVEDKGGSTWIYLENYSGDYKDIRDRLTSNGYDSFNVTLFVKGTCVINDDIVADILAIQADDWGDGNLTVKKSIIASDQANIGSPYSKHALKVTVGSTSTSVESGISCDNEVVISNATVTAKGNKMGIYAYDLELLGAKVTASSANKGAYCAGIVADSIYVAQTGPVANDITASGYKYGIHAYNMTVEDGTVTGKATTTTSTKTLKDAAVGIMIGDELNVSGGSVKGYAKAPQSSISSQYISTGMFAYRINCTGNGTVYASNTGKYGTGLYVDHIMELDADTNTDDKFCSTPTVKAYAKNYGIGIKSYGGISLKHADVTAYGGKYAMRIYGHQDGFSLIAMDSKIYAAGKNSKGTKTGNGIVANYIIGVASVQGPSNITVYAKKTSSYYGIRSISDNVIFMGEGTCKVTAYKSKALKAGSHYKVYYSAPFKMYRNGVKLKNTAPYNPK